VGGGGPCPFFFSGCRACHERVPESNEVVVRSLLKTQPSQQLKQTGHVFYVILVRIRSSAAFSRTSLEKPRSVKTPKQWRQIAKEEEQPAPNTQTDSARTCKIPKMPARIHHNRHWHAPHKVRSRCAQTTTTVSHKTPPERMKEMQIPPGVSKT